MGSLWIDGSFESDFRDDDHGDPTMGYLFWVNGNVFQWDTFWSFNQATNNDIMVIINGNMKFCGIIQPNKEKVKHGTCELSNSKQIS